MWKIAFLVLSCLLLLQEACGDREKRHIIQFGRMIKAMTGRGALSYNNYGCWCGAGGGGRTLDGVDRCCRTHDWCYDRMVRRRCRPKTDFYDYRIRNRRITCNHKGRDNACERGICACDRAAAMCFGRNRYNAALKNIDRRRRC